MSAGPEQYVIADLLANAVEPWDDLTASELVALGAGEDPGSQAAGSVVIAAYRNERGAVLIGGNQRLRWLASPPRNHTVIAADEVRIDPDAVDEQSAHRAAVALHVNQPHASSRVRAVLARRLHVQSGWSQATIAEVFKVSGPAVSTWLRQLSGSDVPEVTGADGKVYPGRGKQAPPDARAAAGTVPDALKAMHAGHQAAVASCPGVGHCRVDRHGSADPGEWTITVRGQHAGTAADLAARLRSQADDLISLALKLEQAAPSARA